MHFEISFNLFSPKANVVRISKLIHLIMYSVLKINDPFYTESVSKSKL